MNNNIIALRMERQALTKQVNEKEYIQLYRDTQPGQNVYWHGFGQPPVLSFRADFDDIEFNRRRQKKRELVKGRFQSGNLGWIDADDMELFACMCRKPIANFTSAQNDILELIEREGPLNIQQIKEFTGMLVKEITPVLHRLQEAFLIYEDQYDGEWDRGWYRFSEMFPDVDTEKYTRVEALKIVLPKFAYRMVWFNADMAKSFYKLPAKDIKSALKALTEENVLVEFEDGFILTSDEKLIKNENFKIQKSIFVMHRNDILVKSYEDLLKTKYKHPEFEILQYLLIEGEIHGAVLGKFKYGPYIIEDIAVDGEYLNYREKIIEEVQRKNAESIIHRFDGKEI